MLFLSKQLLNLAWKLLLYFSTWKKSWEAIAWHLKCILEENKKIKDKKFERVVFNEITKKAVENGIATAKSNIAVAKSMYESGNNDEELLMASQEVYELRIAKFGEEDYYTIEVGRNYAIDLQKANRWEEARELLTKLLATSKQVFGSDHNITKSVESML